MKAQSIAVAVLTLGLTVNSSHAADSGLVAHEWGTFTSLQGGDGEQMSWRPLQTSRLPAFVYDMQKPGAVSVIGGPTALALKSAMVTRQRLETPVIYFYSDTERTVDVNVRFPAGSITEWYPQATEISLPAPVAMTTGTADAIPARRESRIRWSKVSVLPHGNDSALPNDPSGSHYFAARATDATYVRVNSPASGDPSPQTEKFLFYRGAGDFNAPLRVTMNVRKDAVEQPVQVRNEGTEPLKHLFLIEVDGNSGEALQFGDLQPGKEEAIPLHSSKRGKEPIPQFINDLSTQLVGALVSEGLYQREAEAMVKTWQDSWLTEPGTRILYILPRKWTDATLPIEITPAPSQLVRVMVGRAELLTPKVEAELLSAVRQAKDGDATAMQSIPALLQPLGRFAEPALGRALAKAQPSQDQVAKFYALLTTTRAAGQ